MQELYNQIEKLAREELQRANKKFPLFHSHHESHSVISEEVEECLEDLEIMLDKLNKYWEDIRGNNIDISTLQEINGHAQLLACEAVQVAAMAQKGQLLDKDYLTK